MEAIKEILTLIQESSASVVAILGSLAAIWAVVLKVLKKKDKESENEVPPAPVLQGTLVPATATDGNVGKALELIADLQHRNTILQVTLDRIEAERDAAHDLLRLHGYKP